MGERKPLIGITTDLYDRDGMLTFRVSSHYSAMVERAGGEPVHLAPMGIGVCDFARYDGFVLTGGDDPVMEGFGVPTSEHSVRVLPERQAFETELLGYLHAHDGVPVLGVCLGMQMMALTSGGTLNQHLPDTHDTHGIHWEHEHGIVSVDEGVMVSGEVRSKHRQAVDDPGGYRVLARAPDGVIEAIDDPGARFRVGAQWHPERTAFEPLGFGLFDRLVRASRG